MIRPLLTLLGILAVSLVFADPSAAQQSSGTAAKTASPAVPWKVGRTPWGDPDLQGAWTSDSARGIPRERLSSLPVERSSPSRNTRIGSQGTSKPSRIALNASGVQTGGRDGAWRGSQTFRQTSLLVDPPDGRMPPLTPEALKRSAPRDRGKVLARVPSIVLRTLRCTTAASPAGSSAASSRFHTATGIGSSRRRTPSSSATK